MQICLQEQGCFFKKLERVIVLELIKVLVAKEIHVPFCPFFTPKKDVEAAILLDPVWLMSVRVQGKNQLANDLNTSGILCSSGKEGKKPERKFGISWLFCLFFNNFYDCDMVSLRKMFYRISLKEAYNFHQMFKGNFF